MTEPTRPRVLMLYSTCEGQTLKIMQHIQGHLDDAFELKMLSVEDVTPADLADCERLVLGASIRYGHFRKSVWSFIRDNKVRLDAMNTSFYGVNLTARKPEKSTPETNAYMKKFVKLSPWEPGSMAVFAGALLYSRYNWWQTRIIQLIMKITGGSTDTSKDIEMTDWSKVDQYAQSLKKQFS